MIDSKGLSQYYSALLNKLSNSSENNNFNIENFQGLNGKKILITGAAGSIGSELARKIAVFNPFALGLLDINESELHNLKLEVNENYNIPTQIFLGDISCKKTLENAFIIFKPDLVFHVAAYKHIPILESFPEEAIRVNIIGTFNMAMLSGEHFVQKFIFISTDKAVNPVSIMGKSKKIAEIVIHKVRKIFKTDFIIVRLGNVIGSRGSVSELFIKQIISGGPITVTHPEMRRYFMTIQQAVDLSLNASEYGVDGNLFVPNLHDPIYIIELLQELINKFKSDNSEIKIQIIGCRKGEKINEELMTAEENNQATSINGFFKIDKSHSIMNSEDYLEEFSEFGNEEFMRIKRKLFEDCTT